jgi:hypothetical protein
METIILILATVALLLGLDDDPARPVAPHP